MIGWASPIDDPTGRLAVCWSNRLDLRLVRHRVLRPDPAEDVAGGELPSGHVEDVARHPFGLVGAQVDGRGGDVVGDPDAVDRSPVPPVRLDPVKASRYKPMPIPTDSAARTRSVGWGISRSESAVATTVVRAAPSASGSRSATPSTPSRIFDITSGAASAAVAAAVAAAARTWPAVSASLNSYG